MKRVDELSTKARLCCEYAALGIGEELLPFLDLTVADFTARQRAPGRDVDYLDTVYEPDDDSEVAALTRPFHHPFNSNESTCTPLQ